MNADFTERVVVDNGERRPSRVSSQDEGISDEIGWKPIVGREVQCAPQRRETVWVAHTVIVSGRIDDRVDAIGPGAEGAVLLNYFVFRISGGIRDGRTVVTVS